MIDIWMDGWLDGWIDRYTYKDIDMYILYR